MTRVAAIAAALLGVLLIGCGDDDAMRASLVAPAFGEPCRYTDCGEHGVCASGAGGGPRCLCEVGYGGGKCGGCEEGFHLDAKDRCVPDRACAEQDVNPCGAHGTCDDSLGVIACVCDDGYEGPRCELCENGYAKDEREDCLALVIFRGDDGVADGHGDGLPPIDGSVPLAPPDPDRPDAGCRGDDCSPPETCDPGYAGDECELCALGFHRGADERCVEDEHCEEDSCGPHGACIEVGGEARCACDPGFAGDDCTDCAPGFHPVGGGGCALNQQCVDNSCPQHASCDDSSGAIMCSCDRGYTGDDCEGCAVGYYRSYADASCVTLDCSGGSAQAAVQDFQSMGEFPIADNCVPEEAVPVSTSDLTLQSVGGNTTVWACGPSTLYLLASNHVLLDAGNTEAAELIFSHPIASLRFDYAAVSGVVDLEILADGVSVGAINLNRRQSSAVALTFPAPITLLELRGMSTNRNSIALDNIAYEPACE